MTFRLNTPDDRNFWVWTPINTTRQIKLTKAKLIEYPEFFISMVNNLDSLVSDAIHEFATLDYIYHKHS